MEFKTREEFEVFEATTDLELFCTRGYAPSKTDIDGHNYSNISKIENFGTIEEDDDDIFVITRK